MKTRRWNEYLWIAELLYFVLGFFNILFAWLGMIFFMTPLLIAVLTGNKGYCHHYCGRGQLFSVLGSKLSRNKPLPKFVRTNDFRYGFLLFFMVMFLNMVLTTYLVFAGSKTLSEVVVLFWMFQLPWEFANSTLLPDWIAQFAFGFYGVMLTSSLLGIVSMVAYKPRAFCVYCPMGTMTQGICKAQKERGSIWKK